MVRGFSRRQCPTWSGGSGFARRRSMLNSPATAFLAIPLVASIKRSGQSGGPDAVTERKMTIKQALYLSTAATVLAAFATAAPTQVRAQAQAAGITIDSDDIGGVVTGPRGPEAGVWVIAESNDLATKFAKIVVTDDQGRYVIPDLPKANYTIWVRGYGLVDSPKVQSAPGKLVNLTATPAPTEAAAAEYYPGMYWYSMLEIPAKDQFPGTGAKGNGIPEFMKSQNFWIDTVKNACQSCHALGSNC